VTLRYRLTVEHVIPTVSVLNHKPTRTDVHLSLRLFITCFGGSAMETKDDLGRRSITADRAKLVCSVFVTTNKMERWACRTSNKIFLFRAMGS
jgi:hypothetical protein